MPRDQGIQRAGHSGGIPGPSTGASLWAKVQGFWPHLQMKAIAEDNILNVINVTPVKFIQHPRIVTLLNHCAIYGERKSSLKAIGNQQILPIHYKILIRWLSLC